MAACPELDRGIERAQEGDERREAVFRPPERPGAPSGAQGDPNPVPGRSGRPQPRPWALRSRQSSGEGFRYSQRTNPATSRPMAATNPAIFMTASQSGTASKSRWSRSWNPPL